jgi:hypothetical protein
MKSVRDTKQLTVFNDTGGGHWVKTFPAALEAFNTFVKPAGIRVVKASDDKQANVVMRMADGVAKYEYEGTEYTKPFSGTALHGLTRALTRDDVIEKAFIFLPLRPQVTVFDNRGNASDQLASLDVMKVIAVHELIHACCLNDDDDHGGDSVFYHPLEHQNGKLYVPQKGKNPALMPPIRADQMITRKIKELW